MKKRRIGKVKISSQVWYIIELRNKMIKSLRLKKIRLVESPVYCLPTYLHGESIFFEDIEYDKIEDAPEYFAIYVLILKVRSRIFSWLLRRPRITQKCVLSSVSEYDEYRFKSSPPSNNYENWIKIKHILEN